MAFSKVPRVNKIISLILLVVALLVLPLSMIVLGQQARTKIKAATECREPKVPDPADCPQGVWKLSTSTADGCLHFVCEFR